MGRIRFLSKFIRASFREEEGFDYKNNDGRGKSANFWPDNISKINSKMQIVFSYTSSRLRLRNIELLQRDFM